MPHRVVRNAKRQAYYYAYLCLSYRPRLCLELCFVQKKLCASHKTAACSLVLLHLHSRRILSLSRQILQELLETAGRRRPWHFSSVCARRKNPVVSLYGVVAAA